jgi:hypothetical protein
MGPELFIFFFSLLDGYRLSVQQSDCPIIPRGKCVRPAESIFP